MKLETRTSFLLVSMIGVALATFLVRHHPFFWDTIQLGSKHAHWYYENNFRYLLLPDAIDSGHPPAFGMYLALAWMAFGKSLMVSHMAMLPFLLGIVWLLFRIGDYFGGRQNSWMFALLAFADPVLAGQAVLISPDIALMCFFLLALYGILYEKRAAIMTGAFLLAIISTRGMMVVVVLYFFGLAIHWKRQWLYPLKQALLYVPGGLIALAFLAFHYQQKGWIGYHEAMPWAPGFERPGLSGFFKNLLVLGWRMADFGRIVLWPLLGWLAYRFWLRRGGPWSPLVRQAAWLFALAFPLLSLTYLFYRGLHGHRYLLPVFLPLSLLFFTLLIHSPLTQRLRYLFFTLAFAGLLTGNLWIYPDTVSQGWDATLAHLPYYGLREEMLRRIDARGIPLEVVGTAFPEIGPLKFKELNGEQRGMVEKDLSVNRYILYSNVMNDFSDEEIHALRRGWEPIEKLEQGGVRLILYRQME